MNESIELKRNRRNRLFYIDFLSLFRGSFRRADLVKRFDISEPAATNDISAYADLHPEMLRYDPRQKTYVYNGQPPLFAHNVDDSLYALSGFGRGLSRPQEREAHVPAIVGATIKRSIDVELVASLTRAICQRQRVSAYYYSQSRGMRPRDLSPLALVNDGLRWHIRCFDHSDKAFKDYNLARFTDAKLISESGIRLEDDQEWTAEVSILLVPHPKAEHPETIRLDYGIDGESKQVNIRKCFLGYFLRNWPIDFSEDASANPRLYQLFLSNRGELIQKGVSAEWELSWSL